MRGEKAANCIRETNDFIVIYLLFRFDDEARFNLDMVDDLRAKVQIGINPCILQCKC